MHIIYKYKYPSYKYCNFWVVHVRFHSVISYKICQNYLFFSGQCVEVTYFNKNTVYKLSDMEKYLEHTVNSFCTIVFSSF